MNPVRFLPLVFVFGSTCQADPPITNPLGSQPAVTKEAVNYTIRVDWKDAKKGASSIQLVTSEGSFELNTISGSGED